VLAELLARVIEVTTECLQASLIGTLLGGQRGTLTRRRRDDRPIGPAL
jgi:hypothetical protein